MELAEFKKWVKTHKAKDIIGISGSTCDCPIARWEKSQGIPNPFVSTTYHVTGLGKTINPDWMFYFIVAIDRVGKKEITASIVRKILKTLKG